MDKIGAYTNTADGSDEFTEGNPSTGTPATEVDGGWLNGVQRELLEVMTQMGLTPSSADDTLVWQALQAVYGKTFAGNPNSNVAANVLRERCWDTSTSPPTLYVATVADGTPGGSTWTRFTDLLRAASTTLKGIVELATNAETQAGTDSQRAVTPAGLASALGVTGALVPIQESIANSDAEIEITSGIDSTYGLYLVTFSSIVPDTDGDTFTAVTSSDGGSNYDTGASDYSRIEHKQDIADASETDTAGSATAMRLSANNLGNSARESLSGHMWVRNPSDAGVDTLFRFSTEYRDVDGRLTDWNGTGSRNEGAVVNAMKFSMASGAFSGAIRLYGVKNS